MKTVAFTVFTMKQLYEKSDVITKVTLKGRSQAINTMCSQVEVLDIYKGKQNIDGDAYLKTDGSETSVQEILEYDMLDFYMSEERKAQIDEELALGGLDKEAALTEMKSYKQLKNLKEIRASIRSQFSEYGIVS